jgi:hypothetical protein
MIWNYVNVSDAGISGFPGLRWKKLNAVQNAKPVSGDNQKRSRPMAQYQGNEMAWLAEKASERDEPRCECCGREIDRTGVCSHCRIENCECKGEQSC